MDLSNLQPTQDSLSRAASRAMSSETPESLREQWSEAFSNASAAQRLTLLYFANEVCQRSKRTHPEFLSSRCFGGILPAAFGQLARQKPEYADKLGRIVQVWGERDVFDSSTLEEFRNRINDGGNEVSTSMSSGSSKRHRGVAEGSSIDDLVTQSSPQPSPRSDYADALLSLDPVMTSLARAGSSSSMASTGELTDDVAGGEPVANEPYTLEVVRLARTLDIPEQYQELFRRIAQAESESVKFDLDRENQDRLALRVYKIGKSLVSMSPDLKERLASLGELSIAQNLDAEETKVSEELSANKALYDAAETVEHIVMDGKQALESVRTRKAELEKQIDGDQQNLVELSELLQGQFSHESPHPSRSLGMSDEARDEEIRQLDSQIIECESVLTSLKAAMDQHEAQQASARERMLQMLQDQQQQQYSSFASFPATTSQPQEATGGERKRKPRWGDPTPDQPTTATSGWEPAPAWSAAPQQWPAPSSTTLAGYYFPPPPPSAEYGNMVMMQQQYPPPQGGHLYDQSYHHHLLQQQQQQQQQPPSYQGYPGQ